MWESGREPPPSCLGESKVDIIRCTLYDVPISSKGSCTERERTQTQADSHSLAALFKPEDFKSTGGRGYTHIANREKEVDPPVPLSIYTCTSFYAQTHVPTFAPPCSLSLYTGTGISVAYLSTCPPAFHTHTPSHKRRRATTTDPELTPIEPTEPCA